MNHFEWTTVGNHSLLSGAVNLENRGPKVLAENALGVSWAIAESWKALVFGDLREIECDLIVAARSADRQHALFASPNRS